MNCRYGLDRSPGPTASTINQPVTTASAIGLELSSRLRLLSLIGIIQVVVIHACNLTINFRDEPLRIFVPGVRWIELSISYGLCNTAVPLFFMISGYLLCATVPKSTISFHRQWFIKLRARAKSLLIPYGMWSVSAFVAWLAFQRIPAIATFFTGRYALSDSPMAVLKALALNPLAGQFWFIRALCAFVLVLPFIYQCCRSWPKLTLAVLTTAWVLRFDAFLISSEGLLFFTLGVLAALKRWQPGTPRQRPVRPGLAVTLWLVLSACRGLLLDTVGDSAPAYLIGIVSVPVGIWALYNLCCRLPERYRPELLWISQFTFMIFAAHQPLLALIQKVVLHAWPSLLLATYFAAPIITIGVVVFCAYMLKRSAPAVYALYAGGR